MSKPRTAKTMIREMERSFKGARRKIEQSMAKCVPGTTSYLNHLKALADLERKHREERAERGLDGKNLEAVAATGFHFVAHVGVSGAVSTVEVPPDRIKAVLAQRKNADDQKVVSTAEDELKRRELDEEFKFETTPQSTEKDEENDEDSCEHQ